MFELDERLVKSTKLMADLELSQLRLHNDSRYYWLLLVPKVNGVTEVHHLSPEQQMQLLKESSAVAQELETFTQCDKINVANIGNLVPQLHWHIVSRFKDDEAWPGPIWGVGTATQYDEEKRAEFIDSFVNLLKQRDDLRVLV